MCESCDTRERSGLLHWFTRLTECNRCGLFLCPNCFTLAPCESGGEHEDNESNAVDTA